MKNATVQAFTDHFDSATHFDASFISSKCLSNPVNNSKHVSWEKRRISLLDLTHQQKCKDLVVSEFICNFIYFYSLSHYKNKCECARKTKSKYGSGNETVYFVACAVN